MPVADGARAFEGQIARVGDLVVDLVLEEAGIVLRLAGGDGLHGAVLVGEARVLAGRGFGIGIAAARVERGVDPHLVGNQRQRAGDIVVLAGIGIDQGDADALELALVVARIVGVEQCLGQMPTCAHFLSANDRQPRSHRCAPAPGF